jgi:imidazole glycerol-phosphate synthase subunit HisH
VTRPSVVVLDYGSGNIHSAAKALEHAGADVTVTGDKRQAENADGLLVPGVGAFAAVMEQLTAVRGPEIVDRRLTGGRPVLGICVGMQVMFERGIERGVDVEGLGQWPGTVTELHAEVLPHMGWNTVRPAEGSVLFAGIEDERFYFVHSYAATTLDIEASGPFRAPKRTWAEHGEPFLAAVENGPLSATQFHPEKSGEPGIALLRNWIATL